MRYETFCRLKVRPKTTKRLKAAERALNREQAKRPLFAAEIAEEQPTPEERLEQQEAAHAAYWQRIRDAVARTWRKARRILASLPEDERRDLVDAWNRAGCPGKAEYFADFIHQRAVRSASRDRTQP